jgi:hypothetical protein
MTFTRFAIVVVTVSTAFVGTVLLGQQSTHAQNNAPLATGRTARGQPTTPGGKIPQLGDPVFPNAAPVQQPPATIKDLRGNDISWQSQGFWCSVNWKEFCDTTETVRIEKGYEYCSHNLHIRSWNHAKFRIVEVAKDHVSIWFRVQGGDFYDQYGGDFDVDLVIGLVPEGSYSSDRCLPRRSWSAYAHGKNMGEGYYNDRCATMPAFEVPFDSHCASLERYQITGKGGTSAPCITCGKDPDALPYQPQPKPLGQ